MNMWNSYKIGFRIAPALSDNSRLVSQRNWANVKNTLLPLYRLAHRIVPIDYVRWREFSFSWDAIEKHMPSPRKILDISSPKLLPVTLAASLRNSFVHSIDILESEVASVENARRHLQLSNLATERMDARSLRFPDNSFDLITSVSVLEHIEPEKGGEEPVVREIHRVLSPEGIAIFTVPFSRTYFAEYREGTVYERNGWNDEKQFFQRFYDLDTLMKSIVKLSPMILVFLGFIEERFFLKSPHKRSAHYFSGTTFRTMIFGPLYPLLSRIFLSRPKELKKCTKPYLACLVMKKL